MPNPFPLPLLQAISDWQRGGDIKQNMTRGTRLKEACASLPEKYRACSLCRFRQIALPKGGVSSTPFPAAPDSLHREGNWLWNPLRAEWRDVAAKPEEIVRQTFIRHLIDHYGYSLAQMDQERRTQHGRKSPRADIVVWETPEKKADDNTPVLVVDCKSEGVDIKL